MRWHSVWATELAVLTAVGKKRTPVGAVSIAGNQRPGVLDKEAAMVQIDVPRS